MREVVGASHRDLARVRELVDAQPALARATWDWGYGDWESALGAASHVGNRDIAEYLVSMGARPDIFSAAMLGQLEVVRSFIALSPGIQRTRGPHGITLLSHARAGGERAKAVLDYLTTIDGADDRPALQPLAPGDRERLVGSYRIGPGEREQLDVTASREMLTIGRPGGSPNRLQHLGRLTFYPAGAEAVRIRFEGEGAQLALTIVDGPLTIRGERVAE